MTLIRSRIEKLEAMFNIEDSTEINVECMTPEEWKERIEYFVNKMTDKEIADFEGKHGYPQNSLRSRRTVRPSKTTIQL